MITVAQDPEPVWAGDEVTITYTVTPIPDGGFIHYGGALQLPVDPVTGTAEHTFLVPGPGVPELTAWYSGTDAYLGAGPLVFAVDMRRHPVEASLIGPSGDVWRGDPFDLTIDLDEPPDGGRIKVERMHDWGAGSVLAWVDVEAMMPQTITIPGQDPGVYDLRATFEGTGAYLPAVSGISTVLVLDRTTDVTLTVDPSTVDWGEPSVATVAFDPVPDDGGAIKLEVDGRHGTWFEVDWNSGVGSAEVPALEPGTYSLSTTYIPTAWPPRWVATSNVVTYVVGPTPVDTDPPVGWVTIADGAEVTPDSYVVLTMQATDASPIQGIAISCDGDTWTSGGTTDGDQGWAFGNDGCDSNEGVKTVYVRWIDMYGNVGIASDTIILDGSGPIGSTVIADSSTFTQTPFVTMSTAAADATSPVTHVALSNDGTTWTTRAYAPTQAWTLPSTNGTRTVYAKWRDAAGNWSAVTTDTIVLDTIAPTATEPRRGFVPSTALASGAIQVRLPWTGADGGSGVARYELGQQTDGGAWTTVSTTLTTPTATRTLAPLHTYRFRVRPVDRAGNVGAWVYGATFRVSRYNENNARVSYSGRWSTVKASVFLNGAVRKSSTFGSKASITFTGRSIAWIARMGPDRGKAEVYVNGERVAIVDLYASTYRNQRLVWVATWTTTASRKVTIRVLATSGRPRVDLDAYFTAN